MVKTILLFDMDGVLIRSGGYYLSLQSTIKIIAQSLGIQKANLCMDEISKLEAIGVIHIWDQLTLFSSVLMLHIWTKNPSARIPKNLKPPENGKFEIEKVDFQNFILDLDLDPNYSFEDLAEVIKSRRNNLDADQMEYLNFLFQSSREIYQSPVLPIMQEHVLGSYQFNQTYVMSSQLDIQSYPQQHDQPSLTVELFDLLNQWLSAENHCASIFTNRSNLPPYETFFGTPEAEMGAKIIGFEEMPIIGAGALAWMANNNNLSPKSYNKPNPVHALAAIQAALGETIENSLKSAVRLVTEKRIVTVPEEWKTVSQATIFVFEDSRAGLISAQMAGELLATLGISLNMHLIGIGQQVDKTSALTTVTDKIYPDLNSCPLMDIIHQIK